MRTVHAVIVGLLLGAALAVAAEAPPPPPLEEYVAEEGVTFAADLRGNVAAWDRDSGAILTWHASGEPRGRCTPQDARLPLVPNSFAYNDGVALLSFFDFEAGSEVQRKVALVDTDRCELIATSAVPGVVHAVQPTREGWLLLTREPFEPVSSVLRLDTRGEITDAISVDRTFDQLAEELDLGGNPLARTAEPLAVGKDLWLIPHAAYELWYPPQRGRSSRRVTPPTCLTPQPRILRGADSASFLRERAARFPARLRGPLEAAARSSDVPPVVFSATAGQAVIDGRLAVKVLDDRLAEGARLDLWDLTTETVVASVPFPSDHRLLAATDGGLWVIEQGRRVRLHPAPHDEGVDYDPCTALTAVRVAAAATGRSVHSR